MTKPRPDNLSRLLALIPLGVTLWLVGLLPRLGAATPPAWRWDWVPQLGIRLDFMADGLGWLFAILISGIGLLVVVYANGYLSGHPQLRSFLLIIHLFMFAMLGVVLADNLLLLFIFWELTSITSYLLIGFKHEYEASRAAALQALIVTGLGGIALLAGVTLLGLAGGTFQISALVAQAAVVQASPLYPAILVLVLLGAFTKSAQFPFHFWLPGAMEAPAPVSAYLHSATMVKAGIYLLARLTPILGGNALWQAALLGVGGLTFLLGAFLAIQKLDLKRILAYSTISVLGTLVFLLGIGTPLAVKGALTLLLAHSLYKGTLFMVAGIVEHSTGERDIDKLGGLRAQMPLVALAAGVAALSMAGIPPLLGFISKEVFYEATRHSPTWANELTAVAVLGNILLVAVAGLAALAPFFGAAMKLKKIHAPDWQLTLGPLVLAGLGLALGFVPGWLGTAVLTPATSAALGTAYTAKLALWHGFTPELILSILTVGAGGVLYAVLPRLRPGLARLDVGERFGPQRAYQAGLAGLLRLAAGQTRLLQSGYLENYISIILLTAAGMTGYGLLRNGLSLPLPDWSNFQTLEEMLLILLIAVAGLAAVFTRSRLMAVAALGAVGYGVALLYALFSAPDLAMTQFAIETLVVIVFVLVLYRLPAFATLSSRGERALDALVALIAGGMVTATLLTLTSTPLESRLAPWLAENSVPLAGGRNVVNVILVDFRGMDTLGEITVLAIAAVGIFALLRMPVPSKPEYDELDSDAGDPEP